MLAYFGQMIVSAESVFISLKLYKLVFTTEIRKLRQ